MNTIVIRDKTYTFKQITLMVQVRALKHYYATGLNKGTDRLLEIIDDEAEISNIRVEWEKFCNAIFVEPYASPQFWDLQVDEIKQVTLNFFKSLPQLTQTGN